MDTDMTPPGPGRKTGPKPKFTTADVVDAALGIGIDRFTMANVAKKVGVGAPSLYRLFDSRDDLVGACLEEIAHSNPWKPTTQRDVITWPDLLRKWSKYCWDLCEKYPGFALTLFTYPFPQVHFFKVFPHILEDFKNAGLDEDILLYALDFIGDTVITINLSLATYRTPAEDDNRRKLLKKNFELSNQQLAQDLTATMRSTDLYRDLVVPKTDFIIAALEAGIRPNQQWPPRG